MGQVVKLKEAPKAKRKYRRRRKYQKSKIDHIQAFLRDTNTTPAQLSKLLGQSSSRVTIMLRSGVAPAWTVPAIAGLRAAMGVEEIFLIKTHSKQQADALRLLLTQMSLKHEQL